MKNIKIVLIVLFVVYFHLSSAQEVNEESAIMTIINDYFEGQRTDNPELIKRVFHPDAELKFISIRDSKYQTISLEKYLSFFSYSKERKFEDRIFNIDVTGTASSVKLLVKYDTFQYTHYMHLLKTDEGWKIVNKISCQEDF
ncbi:MAG: nuclear transport factor 2 family protein [Cyclobacteriaceae bacterium]